MADLDRLAGLGRLLDLRHERPVPPRCDGCDAACSASPCGAADAVQVVGEVRGEVVEHHVVHVLEVQATRGQVGAHHDIGPTSGELPPHLFAPVRVHVPVQGHRAEPVLQHAAMHGLAGRHAVREDERFPPHRRHLCKDVPEDCGQAFATSRHEHLLDLGRRHVRVRGHNGQHRGVGQMLVDEGRHCTRASRADDDYLGLGRS
mmetsp:Transcript_99058/g.275797  ORF Transcript_99058/g.275797 Transcript_99058/m.275797 type:complete len:203 (-) Transcript_99058:884-1492(-)